MNLKLIFKTLKDKDPSIRKAGREMVHVYWWAFVHVYLTHSDHSYDKYKRHMEKCLSYLGENAKLLFEYANEDPIIK